jgi:hypothetical protein
MEAVEIGYLYGSTAALVIGSTHFRADEFDDEVEELGALEDAVVRPPRERAPSRPMPEEVA